MRYFLVFGTFEPGQPLPVYDLQQDYVAALVSSVDNASPSVGKLLVMPVDLDKSLDEMNETTLAIVLGDEAWEYWIDGSEYNIIDNRLVTDSDGAMICGYIKIGDIYLVRWLD